MPRKGADGSGGEVVSKEEESAAVGMLAPRRRSVIADKLRLPPSRASAASFNQASTSCCSGHSADTFWENVNNGSVCYQLVGAFLRCSNSNLTQASTFCCSGRIADTSWKVVRSCPNATVGASLAYEAISGNECTASSVIHYDRPRQPTDTKMAAIFSAANCKSGTCTPR